MKQSSVIFFFLSTNDCPRGMYHVQTLNVSLYLWSSSLQDFCVLVGSGFNGLSGFTFKEVCSHYSFRCVVGVRYPLSASGCFRLLFCLWIAFPSLRGSFRWLYASRAAVPLMWVVRVLCRQQFEIFPDDKTQTQSYSSCTQLGFKSCDGRQKAFQVNCFA